MKTLNSLCEGTDCKSIFQKEIFGWISSERNTEDEDEIKKMVMDKFIEANIATSGVIKAFKQLMKCKSKYPLALDPKKGQTVYRGFGRSETTRKILSGMNEKDFKMASDGTYYSFNYLYKPHRPLQSFSRSEEAAAQFTYSGTNSMIFITKVNKDFIFTKDFMDFMEDATMLTGEDEVVRVSSKPIKGTLKISGAAYLSLTRLK